MPIVSIGMGGIVHDAHYPEYRRAGFTVIGGYDPNQSRAEFMQKTFNIPCLYSSLEEAAEQNHTDVVFDVAVPGSAILDIVRQLPDNSAVLIQKPMGETLEQAAWAYLWRKNARNFREVGRVGRGYLYTNWA
jgi:predicted dehydrogenase